MFSTLLAASLLALPAAGQAAAAETAPFTDVAAGYWGADAIRWAAAQHIVDGYGDGTFKPDQPVGQKEFIAMLIRAYNPVDFALNDDSADWAQPYMDYAYRLNWGASIVTRPSTPEPGSIFNVPYTRMYVARLITNASGRNYNGEGSIRYLLDSGLSNGKTANTAEGYGGSDTLTRAEAVTFIRTLKQKLDVLYEAPQQTEPYKPETVRLAPAQNWKLAVRPKSDNSLLSYSVIRLDQPSQGYVTTSQTAYAVSGAAESAFGSGLAIRIDKKVAGYGFTKISTVDAPFKDGKFNATLPLSSGSGLYRISIDSPAVFHHSANTIRVAMFYVNVIQ
ncbi:S-layer homology domain-containing protein [Gordoniibacillus kamchatkensis]|uniref:S-layer homology domain-containing protein n=1 Tax=Gordoniibacillus kamchatkensis TaxID=1590651 RepID=UPI000696FE5D|nr:S-layer homology domain-containing protein [Paenibacillus sp. VKM B-2647]